MITFIRRAAATLAVALLVVAPLTAQDPPPPAPQLPSIADMADYAKERTVTILAYGPGGGLGSGVIVTSLGHIITNRHVVDGGEHFIVRYADGSEVLAELLGTSYEWDVAVLKVESEDPLPYADFGTTADVRAGDWAIAIGSPFGLEGTVTLGIISALRPFDDSPEDLAVQHDVTINPGNSGGPLFDLRGKLIAINTAALTLTGGWMGLGISLPIDDVIGEFYQILEEYYGIDLEDAATTTVEEAVSPAP